jgi:hypothetical protein
MLIGTSSGTKSPISLIGGDPARLTSYTCRYFIVRYAAVRIAQALGISLNPTQDWE